MNSAEYENLSDSDDILKMSLILLIVTFITNIVYTYFFMIYMYLIYTGTLYLCQTVMKS
jgi:antibiotic biosynthesis monooxygenase (ABM) superfamily enzyme